jgi:hypothetical protein
MRITPLIAAFVLLNVVCADVTPSISGLTEVTSLQSRRLRSELHEARFRPPKPMDNMDTSEDVSNSAKISPGGDQSPPIRKRKSTSLEDEAAANLLLHFSAAATINNGGGAGTTLNEIRRPPRRQNNQFKVIDHNFKAIKSTASSTSSWVLPFSSVSSSASMGHSFTTPRTNTGKTSGDSVKKDMESPMNTGQSTVRDSRRVFDPRNTNNRFAWF